MIDFRSMTAECVRLRQANSGAVAWRLWGPYLSERQWGTVREDYSPNGDAWNYFSHDDARSRAYRWGEDGLAGVCDAHGRLCLALALWNQRDPFLKERLFGLTNQQGNHGEDVKELYYYLDATPSHSYLKMLYKYPHGAFPYERLRVENARRTRREPEFELWDSGVFDEDRYFDVVVEYAKARADDLLLLITVTNRGPQAAVLHVVPQLWFRNTWAWRQRPAAKPQLQAVADDVVQAVHADLGTYWLHADGQPTLLFCENETNLRRLYGVDGPAYGKDALHECIVGRNPAASNPARNGTKCGLWQRREMAAGGSFEIRLRLTAGRLPRPWDDFAAVMAARRREADEFYGQLQRDLADADARHIQRQALAGIIWSKQFYDYDVSQWLNGDPTQPPPPPERKQGRNHQWLHVNNADVIVMPDKWEYPWYAAWDHAFHCIPLAMIDPGLAKEQMLLLTREWYMHPSGQLPAYEWALGDANPPVQAWAAWRVFQIDRKLHGGPGDLAFLERVFHKLMLNFTWWVNRKDAQGRNVFQGGFLGLDNIGVFDRNLPMPHGGSLEQADGTSWMAMYCLNLMRIALELALHNPVYQDIATKFFEHFLYIAQAMSGTGPDQALSGGGESGAGLWDEDDQFFYDKVRFPDGRQYSLKVRSLVGLTPLFAVETLEPELLARVPEFAQRLEWVLKNRPDLAALVSRWREPGMGERRLLSLLRGSRMKKLLRRALDPAEFLSDYGVRSLSRYHLDHPYTLDCDGHPLSVKYVPGEAESGFFGGNSNWRGPIWFPMNYLLIEALQKFHHYYGDDFRIECPTGSGQFTTICGVAAELSRRLVRLFTRDAQGRRPACAAHPQQRADPRFHDHLLFYEYFHGDDGHGLGAAHQTGWTALVAKLLQPRQEEHGCRGDGRAQPEPQSENAISHG